MRILFLAPEPFYQERGTPIAVDLMLKALCERGDTVDLLTYHLGEERSYRNASITRISPPFAPSSISPGFSFRKVWCDLFMLSMAFRMVRNGRYDLIHAVEEGSFMALLLSRFYRIPYVVDVDSSMADQIVDQLPWLRPARKLLRWFEALPLRRAIAVVPMCEDLARHARGRTDGMVHVLKDVSLITEAPDASMEHLRLELGIEGPMLMYVGNLEEYQGIDLLLESFARVRANRADARLVIIGGSEPDILKYRQKARALDIEPAVHLLGPRPVTALGHYLRQADLLVSPRIQGSNTPMKVYSYLDSGVAVVATALPTHTQVMTSNVAALAAPEPAAMAAAIERLLDDPEERQRLAQNAGSLMKREHSWTAFRDRVNLIFGKLEGLLAPNG